MLKEACLEILTLFPFGCLLGLPLGGGLRKFTAAPHYRRLLSRKVYPWLFVEVFGMYKVKANLDGIRNNDIQQVTNSVDASRNLTFTVSEDVNLGSFYGSIL